MNWKEVIVEINKEAVEASTYILNELGAGGVVLDNKDDKEIIKAYFYNDQDFPPIFKKIKENISRLAEFDLIQGEISYAINETRQEDWAYSWHNYFKAIEVANKFIISPSWEKIIDTDRMLIEIDPGMAFGIGSHETTQICIELLEKYIQGEKHSASIMLDIGTGTGILAIAAAYLGVEEILGIDIDPAAVSAAKKNVEINGVTDQVLIRKGDLSKNVFGIYSILTANLLPNLIIELLPSIPSLMDDHSLLILSGIIKEKKDLILEKIAKLDLSVIDEINRNNWLGLVVIKCR